MEMIFITDRYKMSMKIWSMRKRIRMCIFILLFTAFAEHILYLEAVYMGAIHKNHVRNITNTSVVDDLIQRHLSHIHTFHSRAIFHFFRFII